MNNEEAKKKLKAKLECLKRETSGTDIDCNRRNCDECNLCYEQGNMGEQKEALGMAIKALEQKDKVEESNFSMEQYKADLQADYEAKQQEIYDCGYDCGYNCGYADAMNDIAESEE